MSQEGNKGKDIVILGVGSQNCRVGVVSAELFTSQDDIPIPEHCLHVLARPLKMEKSIDKSNPEGSDGRSKSRDIAIENTKRKIGMPPPRVKGAVIKPRIETEKMSHTDETKHEILIGQKALSKVNDPKYEVIWPIKEGRLNLARLPGDNGRTPTAIEADLTSLWSQIITTYCYIPPERFSEYRVMLLIPDQFGMGFSDAFLHQESVCAAFGAGLSTACVVDIGHEKIAVSCIDEGISINRSRAYYNYGGKDIQELLCYLLCHSNSYSLDDGKGGKLTTVDLLHQHGILTIKESLCHLDLEDETPKLFDLVVRQESEQAGTVRVYPLNIQQELILAPMGVFHIDMLQPVSASHYFETNAEYHEPYDCVNPQTYVEMGGTLGRYAEKGPKDKVLSKGIDSNTRLSLDEAVITSVRQVGNPELYVKLLSNIVLAGGSTMFPYFGKVLEEMVLSRARSTPQLAECSVEVLALPRDNEPVDLSWKGAAIVATAPSVQECWISKQEWTTEGITKVREKVCFRW